MDRDPDVDSTLSRGYDFTTDRDWIWRTSAMFVTGSELLTL